MQRLVYSLSPPPPPQVAPRERTNSGRRHLEEKRDGRRPMAIWTSRSRCPDCHWSSAIDESTFLGVHQGSIWAPRKDPSFPKEGPVFPRKGPVLPKQGPEHFQISENVLQNKGPVYYPQMGPVKGPVKRCGKQEKKVYGSTFGSPKHAGEIHFGSTKRGAQNTKAKPGTTKRRVQFRGPVVGN